VIKPFRPGYYSRPQVAAILGRSITTIRRWEKQKKLVFHVEVNKGGAVRLFPVKLVLELASEMGAIGNVPKSIVDKAFGLFDAGNTTRAVALALDLHAAQAVTIRNLWKTFESEEHEAANAREARTSGPQLVTTPKPPRDVPEPPPPEESPEEWTAMLARSRAEATSLSSEEARRVEERRAQKRARLGLPPLHGSEQVTGTDDARPSTRGHDAETALASLRAQLLRKRMP
jgi:hypothetical protein